MAKKPTALENALQRYAKCLDSILSLARDAYPNRVPAHWHTSFKSDLQHFASELRDLVANSDPQLMQTICNAEHLALQLVNCVNGGKVRLPMDQWESDRGVEEFEQLHRLVVDELKPHSFASFDDVQPNVILDPPQITLSEMAYALSNDQALYLQEVLKADDWLSDSEFRRRYPQVGQSARPDRWRKKLPKEVSKHLETTPHGTPLETEHYLTSPCQN